MRPDIYILLIAYYKEHKIMIDKLCKKEISRILSQITEDIIRLQDVIDSFKVGATDKTKNDIQNMLITEAFSSVLVMNSNS